MSYRVLLVVLVLGAATTATAAVPGGIDVVCDVPRTAFRAAAAGQTTATFRLWSAPSGGSQIGADYSVPTTALATAKRYTDKFAAVGTRKAARINAVIGSDASPVLLPANGQAYVEMQIGTSLFGCDFAATNDAVTRRRLQGVAFARESTHSETCDTCTAISSPVSVRVELSGLHVIADSTTTPLSWDSERYDTGCSGPGLFDNGTPSRLTACKAGVYLVVANLAWNNFSGGIRFAGIRVNGGNVVGSQQTQGDALANSDTSVSTVIDLAAGDYVEVVVFQNRGAPVEVSPGSAPPANTTVGFGMTRLHD